MSRETHIRQTVYGLVVTGCRCGPCERKFRQSPTLRAAIPEILESQGFPYVSASDVKLSSKNVAPRPLSIDEIQEYIRLYATAASNAVHKAGFDRVEIHASQGFLRTPKGVRS